MLLVHNSPAPSARWCCAVEPSEERILAWVLLGPILVDASLSDKCYQLFSYSQRFSFEEPFLMTPLLPRRSQGFLQQSSLCPTRFFHAVWWNSSKVCFAHHCTTSKWSVLLRVSGTVRQSVYMKHKINHFNKHKISWVALIHRPKVDAKHRHWYGCLVSGAGM